MLLIKTPHQFQLNFPAPPAQTKKFAKRKSKDCDILCKYNISKIYHIYWMHHKIVAALHFTFLWLIADASCDIIENLPLLEQKYAL